MKIRSQFIISLIVFGVILIVTVASVIFTGQQTATLSAQKDQAITIQQGASNLNYLSNYYFIYQENLQLDQWHSAYNAFSDDVSSLKASNPSQQALVNTLDGDLQNLKSVFESVVTYLQNAPRNVSVRIDPQFQTQWIRLALQNQVLAVDASQLSQAITNQADQLGLMDTALTFILFGTFGIYFLAIYLLIYRRALNAISNLQAETKIIGEGNLDHRIKTDRKDEVGELSQAFNQMTGSLKTVTASKIDLEQAQTSLRESEQRWATTLASIGDAVIATDLSGRVAFMNGVAEELTGWTFREASMEPVKEIFNIINEQTRIEVDDPVSKVLEKGMVVGLANHTVLIRKDKTEVAIDDSGAPIKDKDGNVTGVVLIFRDITERKKTEEKIAQQALMIASANDAIIGYDVNQRVTFWNKAAERIYGYTTEEAMGKASIDLLRPSYVNITREELINQLKNEGRMESESIRSTKDGRRLNIEAHAILLRDETGKPIGYVSVDRDITRRKKNEEALKQSEHLYHTVFDNSQDGFQLIELIYDKNGKPIDHKFLRVNRAYEEIIGVKAEDILDKTARFISPNNEPHWVEVPDRVLKTGKSEHVELYNKDINKTLDCYYFPYAKNVVGTLFRDITERKNLERQLKDSERLAAIGATAGMVGHDIRNPLQAIIGDVYLAKGDADSLKKSDIKESLQESLVAIEKNTEYINKIVADLQDFARPLNPHLEATNLNQTINDIVAKNGLPHNVKLKVKIAKTPKP